MARKCSKARRAKARERHKNRVWAAFKKQFPTDEASLEEFFRLFPELFHPVCPRCEEPHSDDGEAERQVTCMHCGHNFRRTANTFLHGVQRINAWHGAIWLLGHGVAINAFSFQKLVGNIAYATARSILQKVNLIVHNLIPEDAPGIPSRDFIEVVIRRTRFTPAREHPQGEEWLLDDDPQENTEVGSGATQSDPQEAARRKENHLHEIIENHGSLAGEIFELLELEPIHFEELATKLRVSASELSSVLSELELDRVVVRSTGDFYIRFGALTDTRKRASISAKTEAAPKAVEQICNFIREIFQGIGRKYLPLYLARHWIQFDRKRWNYTELMRVCVSAVRVLDSELAALDCPRIVQFMPS